MNFKTKLLGLLLMASVSAWGLAGCSSTECADGTSEKNGKCVPDVTCGEGTTADAEQGVCVVGEDGCAAGTRFDAMEGTCVVSGDDTCAEGTSFDSMTNTCKPDVTGCGPNTVLSDSGECLPELDALCDAMGAVKVSEGKCVVAEAACSGGTKLSANGNCVVAQEACGTGLALNDNGTCEATEDVCGDKTSFAADMGLCVPDQTCQMGDVVADGVCVSPAEALAQNPDVTESENNDPDNGGTANDLTVKAVGETTAFTGTIEAPRTLDGKDNVQDVDSFKFSGNAGDWFKISVQSLGLPQPTLIVTGPNDFMRVSPTARPSLTTTDMRADDAGRKIVLPRTGDYVVHVMPTAQALDPNLGAAGSEDWDYVGALEKVDAASPTSHDLSMNPLTGTAGLPDNNFWKVTGFASNALVEFSFDSVGADIDGVFQVWSDPTTLEASTSLSAGETLLVPLPMLMNDEFYTLVDWKTLTGPEANYEISARAITNKEDLGAIMPDQSATSTKVGVNEDANYYYTFSVQAGQVIEITHTNAENEEIDYTLSNTSGVQLRSESKIEVPSERSDVSGANEGYYYTPDGGRFILTITAEDADHTDQTVTVSSHTPNDFGQKGVGDSISAKEDGMGSVIGPGGRSAFHLVEFTEDVVFDGTLSPLAPSDAEIEFFVYEAADYNSLVYSVSDSDGPINVGRDRISAGTYVFRIEFEEDINSYELSGDFTKPPLLVGEPNDTQAEAVAINFTDDLAMTLDGNDTDWMSFDIASDMPATESVWFHLGIDSSETNDFNCQLIDGSGNIVHEVTDRDEGCSLMGTGLTQGTYYVKVEYSDSWSYDTDETFLWLRRIEAVAETEPNDTQMMPGTPSLTRNGNRLTVLGAVDAMNTDDVFEFTLPSNIPSSAKLHIGLTMLGPEHAEDTEWELLDGSGASIVKKDYDEVHTIDNPTAGAKHFIKVIGDATDLGSADGEYVVRAEVYNPDQTVAGATGIDFSGGDGTTTTDSVTVSNCATVDRVSVSIDATADEKGEHNFILTGPGGESVAFWPAYEYGDDQEDFMPGNWPIQKVSKGDLSKFNGTMGNGMWTLTAVIDGALSFETRTINSWSLNLDCQ